MWPTYHRTSHTCHEAGSVSFVAEDGGPRYREPVRTVPSDEPSEAPAPGVSPAGCVLRHASRAWIYGGVAVSVTVGLLLVALTAPEADGLAISIALLVYAAALARCLRMSVRTAGETVVVRNGFRTTKVPLSQVRGVRHAVRLNVGLLSGAWYWSPLRRSAWLTLEGGDEVRVSVFTEMRDSGVWRSIGDSNAEDWLRIAHR